MSDLEKALGQYQVYSSILAETEPDRAIYLAVSEPVFANVFDTRAGQVFIKRLLLKIITVSLHTQEIVKWTH
jgi:hypothetical protein